MERVTKISKSKEVSRTDSGNGGEPSGEVFRNISALQAGVLVRFQRAQLRHLRPTPKTAKRFVFFTLIIHTPLRVRRGRRQGERSAG